MNLVVPMPRQPLLPPSVTQCTSFFPTATPPRTLHGMDAGAPPEAEQDNDATLMAAWVRGDDAAFDRLYARHRGPLFRFMVQQLRNRALAEECFQDVWQRVIGARARWTPDAAFSTWLYRIAHNRLNDHWRAQKHRPPAPDDADLRAARIPDPVTPERQLSEFEQRRELQRAIDALPEEQREVVLLRLGRELSLEEIGEITGAGRETVKSRLRYAMAKLRESLNP